MENNTLGPLLDMGTVDVIRSMNDDTNNFLAELIHMFVKESEKAVSNLAEAAAKRDEKALANYLHSFKGMSVNMGAEALSNLCKNMESDLEVLSDSDVIASVEKIKEYQQRTVDELMKQL
jgi:HPt (histidine-containing phosphotransfer) domain-containing protein